MRENCTSQELKDAEDLAGRLLHVSKDDTEAVQILSSLCAFAKEKRLREGMSSVFQKSDAVSGFLGSSIPKVRKNAARLIGMLQNGSDAARLGNALTEEKTLLVIPSMLLALGNLQTPEAKRFLEEYRTPDSGSPEEEKHIREIREAHSKALGKYQTTEREMLESLDEAASFCVISPAGFADVLRQELEEKGFAAEISGDACLVVTEKIAKLYTVRCAREILLLAGKSVPFTARDVCSCARPLVRGPYRVELRNFGGDRREWIRTLVSEMGGTNNPSAYMQEIRVICRGKKADVLIRFMNVPDHRYGYRAEALPASMHPATAACLVRYAAGLFPKTGSLAAVLDPCCGSGTLLFERELLSECRSLFGVDIRRETVLLARNNALAGGSRARFIGKDLAKFKTEEPVDEIYANLPFGNRVGAHEGNVRLYTQLVSKLPEWLSVNGFAVLYTMESRLLEKCLKKADGLEIAARRVTEAGGLYPNVFVVKRIKTEQ